MQFLADILRKIEDSINFDKFVEFETQNIELKDLSTSGEWTSLKETICAFLNTDGGYVVCGVRERDKTYKLNGFDRNNESKLLELQTKIFKDEKNNLADLSDLISFKYDKINETDIAIIKVIPLDDYQKYVHYNGKYFERVLTGDKIIPETKLRLNQEYKRELEYAKEISILENATINDLSLEKINNFINILNQTSIKETLKPSLKKASQFLERWNFKKDEKITILGMLVCGEEPNKFLENRTEIDCYFDTKSDISKDKKFYYGDVLTLMQEAFQFTWGHIKTGRTYLEGGKTIPEYSVEIIKEIINNAIAHRDYVKNDFITITVEPDEYIEIKNPGSFKQKMLIIDVKNEIPVRRIIPGIPESKNPKLTNILKLFDKVESQGRGMTTLLNEAMKNQIDLPYFEFRSDDTIVLRVPSGKLFDDEMEFWINSFTNYIESRLNRKLTIEHKLILSYFYKSEKINSQKYYSILLTESHNHFNAIDSLLNAKLIFEHPASLQDKPVYILDRELLKSDFSNEISIITGDKFNQFDDVTKLILNILYRYSKYNGQSIKPVNITPEIYAKTIGKKIDIKKYETLSRNVRKKCNELKDLNLINKNPKGEYSFNFT